jgi:hypothetical protein
VQQVERLWEGQLCKLHMHFLLTTSTRRSGAGVAMVGVGAPQVEIKTSVRHAAGMLRDAWW